MNNTEAGSAFELAGGGVGVAGAICFESGSSESSSDEGWNRDTSALAPGFCSCSHSSTNKILRDQESEDEDGDIVGDKEEEPL